jgi:hypothetical protein
MARELLCLLFLLILSASCNGVRIKAPKVTECIVSSLGNEPVCICDDQNDDLPPFEKPIAECDSYLATSPDDYLKLYEFTSDVVSRLEVCLNVPRKCK